MMVEIILKRLFALTIFDEWAGIIIDWPVVSKFDFPSIKISALPSIIWTNVSKRLIFSARASPVSNEIALMLPVVFF